MSHLAVAITSAWVGIATLACDRDYAEIVVEVHWEKGDTWETYNPRVDAEGAEIQRQRQARLLAEVAPEWTRSG